MLTIDTSITQVASLDPQAWYRFEVSVPRAPLPTVCWVRRNGNALLLCDRPDNEGRSVFESTEHIVMALVAEYRLDVDEISVYEYLPDVDQYEQIHFADGREGWYERVSHMQVDIDFGCGGVR